MSDCFRIRFFLRLDHGAEVSEVESSVPRTIEHIHETEFNRLKSVVTTIIFVESLFYSILRHQNLLFLSAMALR